jgi:hypothetical protein
MAIPLDKKLYKKAKQMADKIYNKSSAYKSGYIVKSYEKMGGKFRDNGPKKLKQWFEEEWKDIGNKVYPVYRPTKRISQTTPLLVSEIEPHNLTKQIALKQKIKGKKNLPPFKKK